MFGRNKSKRSTADGFGDVFIITHDHSVCFGAITPAASALPDGFIEWHDAASDATDRYLNGEVTRTAALARLAELKFTDVAGTEWAFGVSSHRWFSRKPGQSWQQGATPSVPTVQNPPVWRAEQVDVMTETVVPPPVLGQNPPAWATVGVDNDDLMNMFAEEPADVIPPAPREGSTDAMLDTTVNMVETFANTPTWGTPEPVVSPAVEDFSSTQGLGVTEPVLPIADTSTPTTDGVTPNLDVPATDSPFTFTPDEGMAHTDLPDQPWVADLKNLGWDDFNSPTDGFPTAFFDGDTPPLPNEEGSDE